MDRKTIIAYIVIILVFLLLPYYYKIFTPRQEAPQKALPVAEKTIQDAPDTASTLRSQPAAPVIQPESLTIPDTSGNPAAEFPLETGPRSVIVETPLYHLEFSTRGGVLTSCVLKQYAGHNGSKVELIRSESDDNLDLLLHRKGNPLDLKEARFVPNQYLINVPADGGDSLIMQTTGGSGIVRKVFRFYADRYIVDLRVQAQNLPDLDPGYQVVWGSGLNITETDTAQDIYYSKAYALMGGELESFDGKGEKDQHGSAAGETRWVAQRCKYFEVAIVPQGQPGNGVSFDLYAQPAIGKNRLKVFGMGLNMPGTLNQQPGLFTVYIGPLDEKRLAQADPNLEATMSWGWKVLAPLSKGILWMLKALHAVIPNYGLVVVVFSIIIKIVLWPLTQKSTKSMARMSAIQPKMKELQEKFKGSPDKLNKAVMQLYKEEKVNPFSGCWPVLLQMPLLFALFGVFRSTIEFRGAPFVWWINDLSMPDVVARLPFTIPFYGSGFAILPLIMGATQLLTSKMMITDPKQKFNVYFMPLFMTLFFNTLPSGLTLYYTLFNVLAYLQQIWIKKQGAAAMADAGGR
jgi:YidC/Oxa1 family membrane protein insertase